ncbi:hypothetical protein [Pseudomonas khavaziana]|uniref:Ig-like domain-containing protein n=1 Tax=Pseudomonas khavaziana TaxID=2842351 RepID=A0ABZ2DHP7_9PSED
MSNEQLPVPEILHLSESGFISCATIRKEDAAFGILVQVPGIEHEVAFHWKATADSASGGTNVNSDIPAKPDANNQIFLGPYSEILAPVRRGELKLSYSYADASGNVAHSPVKTVRLDLTLSSGGICEFS